jgi:hypothetical protein
MALVLAEALMLSGCASLAQGDGSRLSDWTSGIGARWDAFVSEVLAPIANALFAILIAWISIAVAARLVTLIPGIRDLRATRRTGRTLRVVGWTLVVVTPIVTVVATAFAEDSFVGWLAVSTPLAYAAVGTLGLGLASRPRVDAKVIMPDGTTNEAWSIDALTQVRNVGVDHPRIRLERANSADFGEFITIADRTGSGLASAIAWVVQALFNLVPWQLQVTVLDGRSAIATLRRNGKVFPEVELELDEGDPGSDQHRKLLAFAAAFTALSMAGRYPDMQDAYAATTWRSIGYLGIARLSTGAERRNYLRRARDADPTNRLATDEGLADECSG